MAENVTLEEAQDYLLNQMIKLGSEFVSRGEACGRVIAGDLTAPADLPAEDQSAQDGYAVAFPVAAAHRYHLIERLSARSAVLGRGEAFRVTTGGAVPAGTVAVIPQEKATVGEGMVLAREKINQGSNIKMRGEDLRRGDLLARRGMRITPGLIGALAAYGGERVEVVRRPRVALLNLGRGIIPTGRSPRPGESRDSNGPMLEAWLGSEGAVVTEIEYGDQIDQAALRMVRELLSGVDLLLTVGGAAEGRDDSALTLLRALGGRLLFHGVQIKPGNHSAAAMVGNQPVIALAGNPAACAVGYHLLAVPLLRSMQWLDCAAPSCEAVCTNSFPKSGGPRRFLTSHARLTAGGWEVTILPRQKSSMLNHLISCNALIDLPARHQPVAAGDKAKVILLT